MRLDGDDHPLLRLADPDLGIAEPRVLERHGVKIDFGAEFGAHLADGAAQSAGAAVGDCFIEAGFVGL